MQQVNTGVVWTRRTEGRNQRSVWYEARVNDINLIADSDSWSAWAGLKGCYDICVGTNEARSVQQAKRCAEAFAGSYQHRDTVPKCL